MPTTGTFYDDRWSQAAAQHRTSEPRAAQVLRLADRYVRLSDRTGPLELLDVGSGWGWLSDQLSRYGKVTGIEPSAGGVQAARERFPRLEFICGQFPHEDLKGRQFDLVVSSEVIEHVGDQAAFAEGLFQVTRPGGGLVLTTPNGKWWSAYRRLYPDILQPVENWLTWRQLETLLRRAGFRVVKHIQWSALWWRKVDASGGQPTTGEPQPAAVPRRSRVGALLKRSLKWGLTLVGRPLKLGIYQAVLCIRPKSARDAALNQAPGTEGAGSGGRTLEGRGMP